MTDAVTAPILIVDDDPACLLSLQAVLAPLGQPVVTARSGEEALRRVLRRPFAVILMDVRMPGFDGLETATLIRQCRDTRDSPILFMTAREADEEEVIRAYEHGAIDYLRKPLVPAVVLAKVTFFVDLYLTKAAQARAEAEAVRLQHLLGMVAHDLRNPLSAIVGSARVLGQLAASRGEVPSREKACLERIERSAARMGRLVQDLLDVTRALLAKTEMPIARRPTDLDALCRAVLDELSAAHPERTITLTSDGPVTGVWDADRVAQVVSNLVTNALQHGAAGAPVSVRLQRRGDEARLEVHNQGPPIPPAAMARLFEPLYREQAHAKSSSIGLGLFIVRQIVQAHGGNVTVRSRAGEGTTFTVELPSRVGPSRDGVVGEVELEGRALAGDGAAGQRAAELPGEILADGQP